MFAPRGNHFSPRWLGAAPLLLVFPGALCLDNGLAKTPPMGWLAWWRFKCQIDCRGDPENCVSEKLFQEHIDVMATLGWAEAGYTYVAIDDCWSNEFRQAGLMLPNETRFRSGIRALSTYAHERGLQLGMYTSVGIMTCKGYLAICADEECESMTAAQDAKSFAEWHVDGLKLDACGVNQTKTVLDRSYLTMGHALGETGRPMLFSCSWPFYLRHAGYEVDYSEIADHCNTWRAYADVENSWDSIVGIVDWYGDNQDSIQPATGAGHWNDFDQLMIGNGGLSKAQMRAHMALWCIAASPLLMGNDLRNISADAREVLLSPEVIAVNQQPTQAGRRLVHMPGSYDLWTRSMGNGDLAVLLWNRAGTQQNLAFRWQDVGLKAKSVMSVQMLYERRDLGCVASSVSAWIDPDDVLLLRLSPASSYSASCMLLSLWSPSRILELMGGSLLCLLGVCIGVAGCVMHSHPGSPVGGPVGAYHGRDGQIPMDLDKLSAPEGSALPLNYSLSPRQAQIQPNGFNMTYASHHHHQHHNASLEALEPYGRPPTPRTNPRAAGPGRPYTPRQGTSSTRRGTPTNMSSLATNFASPGMLYSPRQQQPMNSVQGHGMVLTPRTTQRGQSARALAPQ